MRHTDYQALLDEIETQQNEMNAAGAASVHSSIQEESCIHDLSVTAELSSKDQISSFQRGAKIHRDEKLQHIDAVLTSYNSLKKLEQEKSDIISEISWPIEVAQFEADGGLEQYGNVPMSSITK